MKEDDLKRLKERLSKLKNLKQSMAERNTIIEQIKEIEEEIKEINPSWFRRMFKIGNKIY